MVDKGDTTYRSELSFMEVRGVLLATLLEEVRPVNLAVVSKNGTARLLTADDLRP